MSKECFDHLVRIVWDSDVARYIVASVAEKKRGPTTDVYRMVEEVALRFPLTNPKRVVEGFFWVLEVCRVGRLEINPTPDHSRFHWSTDYSSKDFCRVLLEASKAVDTRANI